MKPHLIALTGPAGCGKDTVAEILFREHGYTGVLSFADPIRAMLNALFVAADIDTEYMTNRTLKELPIPELMGISYRQLAQTLGTEWGRNTLDRRFWVVMLIRRIKQLTAQGHTHFVITDLRFNDVEATFVRDNGGEIWRVVREVPSVRFHVSELDTHAIHANRKVMNTGTLEDLRQYVHEMMQERR